MAGRPEKLKTDFNPQLKIFNQMKDCLDEKAVKEYIRHSSSSYISNKAVKKYILKRDNYKCVLCGSEEDLQIDHIKQVYLATMKNIFEINCLENLRTLCKLCHAKKGPNE